jgi:mevalonate kinase
LPLVTTRSIATDEYVAGRKSILRSTAGDLDDFCEQIHDLIKRQIELKEVAIADRNAESLIHSRRLWSELLNEILLDG